MNIARRTRWGVVCSVSLLAVVACEGRSRPAVSAGRAVDIDSLPTIAVTPVQRFGSEESSDTGFSIVGGVDVDGAGLVYAVDRQDFRIRVFSPNGQLLRMIGRRGGGPGEFESAPRFGLLGDTLWAYDLANRRLTLFDRLGRVLSTAQVTPVEVPVPDFTSWKGILSPILTGADGRLLGSVQSYRGQGGPPQQGLPDTLRDPEVEWDTSGRVVDTVGWYRAPHLLGSGSRPLIIGRQIYTVPPPPSDRPLRLLLPDGQIVVDRSLARNGAIDSLSVTRTRFSGDTLYHRVFRYRPVGYPSAVLDSLAWKHAWPAVVAAGPGGGKTAPSPEAERAVRSKMKFPSYQPPVQDALAGAEGGVWLRREDRGEKTYEWVVLGSNGSARGVVELPRAVHPAWVKGDRLLAVSTDSVGVPWVVEYRLEASQ